MLRVLKKVGKLFFAQSRIDTAEFGSAILVSPNLRGEQHLSQNCVDSAAARQSAKRANNALAQKCYLQILP